MVNITRVLKNQSKTKTMMKKRDLWIYRGSTGLLTLLMLFSASMYFAQYEMVSETFVGLGFPVFIIYPLAIVKYLGLIAIWTNKSAVLKEWAYAGFAFDLLLAAGAHLNISDGEHMPALFGLVLVIVSRIYYGKLSQTTAQ